MKLSSSIDGGLEYIRSNQACAGFWCDWRLPPGESKMWTTAYIGYRLSSLPRERRAALDEHLTRADSWLRKSEFPTGGWGYSEETGPDADSTSLALLFLRARGRKMTSDRWLSAYQQPDGGFSTYRCDASYGSWVQSHPDVTATALLAILSMPFPLSERISAAVRYVRDHQRADGLWNSFWWTSCLYATEATLAVLQAAGEHLDRERLKASLYKIPTPGAFETALLLLCLIRVNNDREGRAASLARALLEEQLPDASWPSRPILRLTSREISEPWQVHEAGPLFRDEKRVFTTATVLAALAAFEGRGAMADL